MVHLPVTFNKYHNKDSNCDNNQTVPKYDRESSHTKIDDLMYQY